MKKLGSVLRVLKIVGVISPFYSLTGVRAILNECTRLIAVFSLDPKSGRPAGELPEHGMDV